MVDALVSGASAARRAGSTPVLGTKAKATLIHSDKDGEVAELVDALL